MRIMLGTSGDVTTYSIFVLFILTVLFNHVTNKEWTFTFNKSVLIAVCLFLFSSVLSMLIYDVANLDVLFKFFAGVVVAYMAGNLTGRQSVLMTKGTILLSTLYGVYCIASHQHIYSAYVSTGIHNYLEVTLPLGLGLTFSLIYLFICKNSLVEKLCYYSAAAIQLFAMLKFSARGNLVFPFLITIVLLLYKSRVNKNKAFRNFFQAVLIILIALYVITRFASEFLLSRLTRMFSQLSKESRVPIYRYFIGYIFDHVNYIWGFGFGRSGEILHAGGFVTSNYPHNFVMEIVGEMGIVGIALLVCTSVQIIKAERAQIFILRQNSFQKNSEDFLQFFLMNAGLLFYLFTYIKSYSIYDGYQLFIFISMLIHGMKRRRDRFPSVENSLNRKAVMDYVKLDQRGFVRIETIRKR